MKILFFSHYYSPEGNAPATRVSALCERWAKAGHEVTVVTCPPNVPNGVVYDGYANKRTSETINGVKVERVKLYIAANKGAVKRMLNFVSYFFKALLAALRLPKPDVVIATSPQIFCGYAGVWYKRLRHVPLVIEIRDIWPESMGAVGAHIPKLAYWALEKIERTMYRTCDKLVTVGEGYRVRLMEKGVPEDKISIVMNGTDLAVYRPMPKNEALLEKYGLKGKFVVSYIGTVGMACGLEVVLDAAEALDRINRINRIDRIECGGENNLENPVNPVRKEIVYAIVGDGAHREQLEAEAKRRGGLDARLDQCQRCEPGASEKDGAFHDGDAEQDFRKRGMQEAHHHGRGWLCEEAGDGRGSGAGHDAGKRRVAGGMREKACGG